VSEGAVMVMCGLAASYMQGLMNAGACFEPATSCCITSDMTLNAIEGEAKELCSTPLDLVQYLLIVRGILKGTDLHHLRRTAWFCGQ